MAISNEQQKSQSIIQKATLALRYGRDLDRIEAYQVGDIHAEEGVYILPQAAVVGDIEAPKVIVAGLVYGYIVASELVIESGGQVWGDVYTGALHLEEGGKIHGWISSPNNEKMDGEPLNNFVEGNEVMPPPELAALGPEFPSNGANAQEQSDRAAIFRQLQMEAAVAIMARLELERSFGNRVEEVAGESLRESARLRDEVRTFREEQTGLLKQVEQLERHLKTQEETIETKSADLTTARNILEEKNKDLEKLQTLFEQQGLKMRANEATRQKLEEKLAQETEKGEKLGERVSNLESALQGSLQHTAEQEEALIRWQELAEVTEMKAVDLEDELEAMKLQLKESTQVVDMLRGQRDKLEKEWDKANRDLMEVAQDRADIKADLDKKSGQMKALEDERDELQASLNALQERIEAHPPEYEQAIEKLEMAAADIADLEEKLNQSEAEAQEYHDQWLWAKASLDTTCSELDAMRQSVGQYEEKVEQLENKIDDQETMVEDWKNNIGRMTNLLYQAQKKINMLENALEKARKEVRGDEQKEALQGEVRKQRLQIEAYEEEITHIHEEIGKQSRRLAEMQATLVERELMLAKTLETAKQLGVNLVQIKRLARNRVQKLETELAETKQKLRDLSVWMERRQKRGEKLEPQLE